MDPSMERGFRFAPADHDLTDVYLGGEIAGRPVVSRYIRHADLYSALPETHVSGALERVRDRDGNVACYFYSPVRYRGKSKVRRIDGDPRKSYWHSEGGKTPLEGSKIGGYVQDFVQVIKSTAGRKDRTGWRMKEYGLSTAEHGDSDVVLCKVYRTPRKPSTTQSTSTTSATTAEEPAAISSKKRKAVHPEDSMPSARPRQTDEHPPTTATDPEPKSVGDDEQFKMYCSMAPAPPPPSSFFHGVEQEFPTLYPVALTEEASPPRPPAAQSEEHASFAADHQMDAILGETDEAHPEQQPDDEAIYGLPCPAFSPEMIRRCIEEPWPSPSSMSMIFGLQ